MALSWMSFALFIQTGQTFYLRLNAPDKIQYVIKMDEFLQKEMVALLNICVQGYCFLKLITSTPGLGSSMSSVMKLVTPVWL